MYTNRARTPHDVTCSVAGRARSPDIAMINRPGRPLSNGGAQEPIEQQFEFIRTCDPSKLSPRILSILSRCTGERDIAFVTLASSIHRSHPFERQHHGQRLSKVSALSLSEGFFSTVTDVQAHSRLTDLQQFSSRACDAGRNRGRWCL